MRRLILTCGLSLGLAACSALLGDFNVDPASVPDAGAGKDDASTAEAGDADSIVDTGIRDTAPDGPVAPNNEVVAVAANTFATCATVAYDFKTGAEKRVTYCWGAGGNDPSFLGALATDPTFGKFSRPRAPGSGAVTFLAFDRLAASPSGLAFLGRTDVGSSVGKGLPFCWGSNSQAECGIDSNPPGTPPISVPPTQLMVGTAGMAASSIGLAPFHGCFVDPAKKLYCWGQNNNCEVRSGTLGSCGPQFVRNVVDEDTTVVGSAGAYEFERFAGGYEHSCVVKQKKDQTSASVACWGKNNDNQCGQGATLKPFVDDPSGVDLPVAKFGEFEIAAGQYHTCAIVTQTDLYCWGRNDQGQAAPGGSTAMPADVANLSVPITFGTSLKGLALGADVSCFVAAPVAGPEANIGRAICFGNKSGPLGRDPSTIADRFAPVSGIKDVQAIAVGGSHACAIAYPDTAPLGTRHGLFCWGLNDSKQVDPDSTQNQFPLAHGIKFPAKP